MKQITSKSGLAIALSRLRVFDAPKVMLEQYATDSEIAAALLWQAYMKGDIEGKVSADLGCGTGILGIGALLLNAKTVVFLDKDQDAIKLAKENLEWAKKEYLMPGEAQFQCKDVSDFTGKCDIVVQNPPFGIKVSHADRPFLEAAFKSAPTVYSMHKSECMSFLRLFSEKNGYKITDATESEFPLKACYSFHSRRIMRIKVSLVRFQSIKA